MVDYPNSWMDFNGKSESKMDDLVYNGTLHIPSLNSFPILSCLILHVCESEEDIAEDFLVPGMSWTQLVETWDPKFLLFMLIEMPKMSILIYIYNIYFNGSIPIYAQNRKKKIGIISLISMSCYTSEGVQRVLWLSCSGVRPVDGCGFPQLGKARRNHHQESQVVDGS